MKRNLPEEIANQLVKVSRIRRGRELVTVDNKPVGERQSRALAAEYSSQWKQVVGHIVTRTINECIDIAQDEDGGKLLIQRLEELKGDD